MTVVERSGFFLITIATLMTKKESHMVNHLGNKRRQVIFSIHLI